MALSLWRSRTASSTLNLLANTLRRFSSEVTNTSAQRTRESMMNQMMYSDINSRIGSCMPLSAMRIGTIIHNIELNPGQGGKLVRAAGTSAKILKEPTSAYCLIQMPSGVKKLIDSRCRATIGVVSNPSHGDRKLRKAGHSRWLGRRPVVRGVAMNPVDHPHGGGEAPPHVYKFPQFCMVGKMGCVLLLEQLKRRSELGSGGEGKPAVTAMGETYCREEQEELIPRVNKMATASPKLTPTSPVEHEHPGFLGGELDVSLLNIATNLKVIYTFRVCWVFDKRLLVETAEAEKASLQQQRKIEELEAQLNEAEDVVTDLWAELKRMANVQY
ncbi:large subunit ribosomal protein L2 [Vigna unguiculata]|uniref:Large subunit ribosomal protein L2 n=1 Tax=Vigna unguiculata TaxID=3917 RepID=A0A4D6LIG5_VIGUN|nr:large subunit ribosomal protein L2 [Vigna unguiculata]